MDMIDDELIFERNVILSPICITFRHSFFVDLAMKYCCQSPKQHDLLPRPCASVAPACTRKHHLMHQCFLNLQPSFCDGDDHDDGGGGVDLLLPACSPSGSSPPVMR
mmetsp:Transcript_14780/g.32188  ORF Transcript_14780/g.32188 Transcript_14780/m.32188 type:complete len:107 (-) Transcript_14780:843-1163(-)